MKDRSQETILSCRIDTNTSQAFAEICIKHNTTISEAIRLMIQYTVENNTTKINFSKIIEESKKEEFTDEEIVALIFEQKDYLRQSGLNNLAESLLSSRKIPIKLTYHCYGKMVLAGVLL